MKLILFLYSILAASVDLQNQENVKNSLSSMVKVLMDYYQSNNYGGSVTENDSKVLKTSNPKGVDGFQWFEGGIFWGIMMEYVRATGDTQYDTIIGEALATASNGPTGSFLGPVPKLAGVAGKWNDGKSLKYLYRYFMVGDGSIYRSPDLWARCESSWWSKIFLYRSGGL
jgi:hypothetical protein